MATILPRTDLITRLLETRKHTEKICENLETEDFVVQPVEYVSPPKWHLGHVTWFFEHFILRQYLPDYRVFDEQFSYIFNSYYEAAGKRVMRTDRGNLSRPTVKKIYEYREYVDRHLKKLTKMLELNQDQRLTYLIEVGINHEQQHQELLLTDIKFILGHNPLFPEINITIGTEEAENNSRWLDIPGSLHQIGYSGEGFCYDNELKSHQVYTSDFSIRSTLVTNREYLDFIEEGGYQTVAHWHSEGWAWLEESQIKAPLYWHKIGDHWCHYGFRGLQKIALDRPVCHISYYEAAAFCEWKGWRLPTEFEWEKAADHLDWGVRWEWTESAYLPYPGFEKEPGALGEYNGKFMVNQKVLRGSSLATSHGHSRKTYRNFFHPDARWQYTGLRPVQKV